METMWSRRLDLRKNQSKNWAYRRSDSTSVFPATSGPRPDHGAARRLPGAKRTRIKVFRPDPLGQRSVEGRRETTGSRQPDASPSIRTLIRAHRLMSRGNAIFWRRGFLLTWGTSALV